MCLPIGMLLNWVREFTYPEFEKFVLPSIGILIALAALTWLPWRPRTLLVATTWLPCCSGWWSTQRANSNEVPQAAYRVVGVLGSGVRSADCALGAELLVGRRYQYQ